MNKLGHRFIKYKFTYDYHWKLSFLFIHQIEKGLRLTITGNDKQSQAFFVNKSGKLILHFLKRPV
jgi:hypothetical protein